MFEKFHVPALYEEIHSVLSFNAAGTINLLGYPFVKRNFQEDPLL